MPGKWHTSSINPAPAYSRPSIRPCSQTYMYYSHTTSMLVFMGHPLLHQSMWIRGSGAAWQSSRLSRDRPSLIKSANSQTSITTTILPPVAFDFPPSTELCSQYLSILAVCFPLLLLQDKEHLLCMTNDVYLHIFTYIRSLRNASGTPNHRMTYQYTNTHTHYARNTADEGHPGGKQRTGEDSSSV